MWKFKLKLLQISERHIDIHQLKHVFFCFVYTISIVCGSIGFYFGLDDIYIFLKYFDSRINFPTQPEHMWTKKKYIYIFSKRNNIFVMIEIWYSNENYDHREWPAYGENMKLQYVFSHITAKLVNIYWHT